MADPRSRVPSGPHAIRVESGQLLAPESFGARIENMYPTEEGTLRSVWGPCPYLMNLNGSGQPQVYAAYTGTMHGIFHALIQGGQRDILLIQSGNTIMEYLGRSQSWRVLLGSGYATPVGQDTYMADDDTPRAPAQFEATPNGIVIIPQDGRAFFYDGHVCLPLGYSQTPAPPNPFGPKSSGTLETADNSTSPDPGLNNTGYAHDALPFADTGMWPFFGTGRVGTVERFPGALSTAGSTAAERSQNLYNGSSGQLLEGRYRAAVQWIDRWGNLSPLSGRSASIKFDLQRSRRQDADPPNGWTPAKLDLVLKQIAWTSIEPGPEGTLGRILYRTRDELNSGTTDLFEVPPNAAEGQFGFATLPDNVSTIYPDNIPDAWLVRRPVTPVPVGKFSLCRMAFGRLWAANFEGDPGRIHPSMPGRWGTFLAGEDIYPDPSGKGITGLWRVAQGLLAFTETNTFLITPVDDSGGGFKYTTLSPTAGCVAPSSLGTLSNGLTIWLGREGFYGFDGNSVQLISDEIAWYLRRLNTARAVQACAAVDPRTGEYRCWIPVDASRTNNICLTFDGGWRRRSDVKAAAVCVTQDHRAYTVVAGLHTGAAVNQAGTAQAETERDGVWVLDHEVYAYLPDSRTSLIETSWLAALRSKDRRSPLTVSLWLRESTSGNITVQAMRDWRETPVAYEDTTVVNYPTEDTPPFWGTTTYPASGGTADTFVRRRPYWRRVDISMPACEVFKIRVTSTEPWEFIGLVIDENPKELGGGRMTP